MDVYYYRVFGAKHRKIFSTGYHYEMQFERYLVIRRTPKGVWINGENGREKFILNGEGKRYAYPTLKQAIESFGFRKASQVKILKFQLEMADTLLQQVLQSFSVQPEKMAELEKQASPYLFGRTPIQIDHLLQRPNHGSLRSAETIFPI
jgi:hypothetical protein